MTSARRLSKAGRASMVRRVLIALGRFGGRVRKVSVHLAEPANPLGGVDQRCRMRVWLQASGDIRAEALDGRIDTAVSRAAARLAARVGRMLDSPGSGGAGVPVTAKTSPSATRQPTRKTAPAGSRPLRAKRP